MFNKHPDFRKSDAASEARINEIIGRMTVEEKIALLGGSRDKKAHGGDTIPCPRVGIPSFKMADASVGVHWWTEDSTTFPASIALAATFDTDLAYRYGAAVGRECRARGIHVLLGPGVNIYRSALCSRNFEYLGEDPCLAALMVTAYVCGLQDQKVAATVKHYAVNYQEYERHRTSSDVDERTLREVYLPAFEAAVREGGAAAIMTAYNLVNSVHCAEHYHLIRDILKGEWEFDGLVMSDWVSVYDTVNTATAGLDMEMPVAKWMTPERLLPALRDGRLSEAVIDDKIRRLLRVAFAFGWMEHEQQDKSIPLHDEASAAVALDAARESIVLLANDGILPLDMSRYRRIAVIGPCGHPAVIGGGGSSYNKPWRSVSIYEGIKALAPASEVVFVLTAGGNIDMRGWHDRVRAIVLAWYPGQEGGTAVAEVLTGRVNPSGRLPATFEHRLEDRSSFDCYHDDDEDMRVALTDGVFGGYRHFDRTGVAPRYPFGFGLSYTTFAFENLTVRPSSGKGFPVEVSFDIVNTGRLAGKAVAQVYVGEVKPRVPRPVKELRGFCKVSVASGERKRVSVTLDRRAFAFFDMATDSWAVTPGKFTISVGASAADIGLAGEVSING
jgi:beta-glucosidase